MKEYKVIYKEHRSKKVMAHDKPDLIKQLFEGNENKFKEEVAQLQWSTIDMLYTEDISSGEIKTVLTSADVNPYGWRNEAD